MDGTVRDFGLPKFQGMERDRVVSSQLSEGWGCSSVVERLLNLSEALGSIPKTLIHQSEARRTIWKPIKK